MSGLIYQAQRFWFRLTPGARLVVALSATFTATVALMAAVGVL